MTDTIYRGFRRSTGSVVTVDNRPLNPRFDLWNHSPTGFEWSYPGSGPAQLALALLANHTGNDDLALDYYQHFKSAVIARLAGNTWALTDTEVQAALDTIIAELAVATSG